jgi:hypothetical protein
MCCLLWIELVEIILIGSLETCIKEDTHLIENNLHVASMSHRTAMYLDELFLKHNEETEWNRTPPDKKATFTSDLIRDITKIIDDWSRQEKKMLKTENFNRVYPSKRSLSAGNRNASFYLSFFSGD